MQNRVKHIDLLISILLFTTWNTLFQQSNAFIISITTSKKTTTTSKSNSIGTSTTTIGIGSSNSNSKSSTTSTQLYIKNEIKEAQTQIDSLTNKVKDQVDALNQNIDPFVQRIESVKCAVIGALSGGIALTPVSLVHNTLFGGANVVNGLAQWEFDTDMGSLEAALFAIVYRYCVREDENPMLKQGVVGAFILVRTLSKIQVPAYCSAIALDCGAPFGYFDWEMISQGSLAGLESIALFGASAYAMEYCFNRGFVSKMK